MSRDGTVSAGANGPAVVFGKKNRDYQGPQPASEGGQGANSASLNEELFRDPYTKDYKKEVTNLNDRLLGMLSFSPGESPRHMYDLSNHVNNGGIQESNLEKGHDAPPYQKMKKKIDKVNRPPLGQRIMGFLRGNPPVPKNTALEGVSMRSIMEAHIHSDILKNQQNIASSAYKFERENKYLENRSTQDYQDYMDGIEPEDRNLAHATQVYRTGKSLGDAKMSYDHDRLRNMSDEEVYDYAASTGIFEGDNLEKAASSAAYNKYSYNDRQEFQADGDASMWAGFGSGESFTDEHREGYNNRSKFVFDRSEKRGENIANTLRSWMGQ